MAEEADSLTTQLHEVEVVGSGPAPVRSLGGGVMRYNTSATSGLMRSMGENDMLNRIKLLPGVRTAGDYGSGLIVDGAAASQSLCRLASVPVFFPYRFGGIFSTFNTPHFKAVVFERTPGADKPARIGAAIDFEPFENIPDRFSGTVNVGMLASSLTLKIPMGRRWAVAVSGRVSYVDALYPHLLRGNGTAINYSFADVNLTVNGQLDRSNKLSLNAFYSNDRLVYGDRHYAMDTKIGWHNTVASLAWRHDGGTMNMCHRLYISGFANRLKLDMPQFGLDAPSSIGMIGISGEFSPVPGERHPAVTAGYELNYYRDEPQTAALRGYGDGSRNYAETGQTPLEARVFARADRQFSPLFSLSAGISLLYFHNAGYNAFRADPRVAATFHVGKGDLTVSSGLCHQFLHQAGFSEIGLSSDFWLAAGRDNPPQRAMNFGIDYLSPLPVSGLSISGSVYYRLLSGQPEYQGQILDLLDSDYHAPDHVLSLPGYNAGANISLRKESGWLTGAATLAYGRAMRRFADAGMAPGRTDAGWTASLNADWRFTPHWSAGVNFVFSQGRRYTPTEAIYVIAGNMVCLYGDRNSARLPAYHRLDISATYRFATSGGRIRHYANFSFINVYGRRNAEMQLFNIDMDNGSYYLRRISSLYRFMPSLSYTLEF